MFLITDYKNYLCGSPYYENGDNSIWFTKNKNDASKYTLEQCFEYFEKYPQLLKEKFTCIEVENEWSSIW